jgi:hypothetical protein
MTRTMIAVRQDRTIIFLFGELNLDRTRSVWALSFGSEFKYLLLIPIGDREGALYRNTSSILECACLFVSGTIYDWNDLTGTQKGVVVVLGAEGQAVACPSF